MLFSGRPLRLALAGSATFLFFFGAVAGWAAERSPEQTVSKYLAAMQGHRFAEAYDYVSSTMQAGKPREVWAKEQQYIVQFAEVKIFEYKVFDLDCNSKMSWKMFISWISA